MLLICILNQSTIRSMPATKWQRRLRPSLAVLRCVIVVWGCDWVWCASTALHSRTAGRCAGRGSPQSEQARGSERTAASASLRRGAPFSWAGLCELCGTERGRWWIRMYLYWLITHVLIFDCCVVLLLVWMWSFKSCIFLIWRKPQKQCSTSHVTETVYVPESGAQ